MVEEQRFFYRNKNMYTLLIFGLLYLIVSIASFLSDEKYSWHTVFHFSIFVVSCVIYLNNKRNGYVKIKQNGELKLGFLFSKPIQLKEVTKAKIRFGNLFLHAPNRMFVVASAPLGPQEFERLLEAVSQWVAIDMPNRQAVS